MEVNGWDQYQRLVLTQLQQHGDMLGEIKEMQFEFSKQSALDRQSLENFKDYSSQQIKQLYNDIHNDQTGLVVRMANAEDNTIAKDAVDRYKKWLFGLLAVNMLSFIGNMLIATLSNR